MQTGPVQPFWQDLRDIVFIPSPPQVSAQLGMTNQDGDHPSPGHFHTIMASLMSAVQQTAHILTFSRASKRSLLTRAHDSKKKD